MDSRLVPRIITRLLIRTGWRTSASSWSIEGTGEGWIDEAGSFKSKENSKSSSGKNVICFRPGFSSGEGAFHTVQRLFGGLSGLLFRGYIVLRRHHFRTHFLTIPALGVPYGIRIERMVLVRSFTTGEA